MASVGDSENRYRVKTQALTGRRRGPGVCRAVGAPRSWQASVVSHKSLVFGCSKNAPGHGVRTEHTRSGL